MYIPLVGLDIETKMYFRILDELVHEMLVINKVFIVKI